MARHGKSRGGFRGGGGRGNKNKQGGYIGGKSRRGGRGGNNNGNPRSNFTNNSGDFPELMDIENPDFISVSRPEKTLKAAAARRSRFKSNLQNEAFDTEENRENTMRLPLRNRPVEFVKSKTYDPSKDLIRILRAKEDYLRSLDEPQALSVEVPINDVTTTADFLDEKDNEVEEVVPEEESNLIMNTSNESFKFLIDHGDPSISVESSVVGIKSRPQTFKPSVHDLPDDQLFFVDNDGQEVGTIKTVEVEPPSLAVPSTVRGSGENLEFTPTLTIGHVQLTTREASDGQYAILPRRTKALKNLNNFDVNRSIYELDDDFNRDTLDLEKDVNKHDLYRSYNAYISNVLNNAFNDSDDDSDDNDRHKYKELELDQDDEIDEVIDGDIDDEEDYKEKNKFIDSSVKDDEEYLDEFNENSLKMLNIDRTTPEPEDPEYGFLPEDYETFDNSLVDVINIRYGSNTNQYFMKSFMLTGSHDFSWIDQELFTDFLLEKGMPEHRVNAYFKYIQSQLAPEEEVEEKEYDIEFSDSTDDYDDSNERNELLYEDDLEGLDDLINYTTKYNVTRNQEFEPTQSLKTRGKGRKKELVLDHIADDELRESLNEKYQIRRYGKKQKKDERESKIENERASSQDLSLKYPFSLHVMDFKTEFESFFVDQKRNTLNFPPMDPHGIKTVGKFAYYYNMKCRKFGEGLKAHAVVIKNKRTFRSIPDYHSVANLMKQRRVFNRIDQKRSRTEIEEEASKSSRRGNPSKAHVKEGDIVGASAPEIASDNIGRRLLVKMGWSSGQGLGLDNKGAAEPVIAKVKKTKVGIR